MTATAKTEIRNQKAEVRRPGRKLGSRLLAALFAEWKKLSASLSSELPERELRLRYANDILKRIDKGRPKIASWSEMTPGEARRVLKQMARESGSQVAYLVNLAGRVAAELWGSDWDDFLSTRLGERFHRPRLEDLEPGELHSLIEELLSRMARRDGTSVEEARAKYARGKL